MKVVFVALLLTCLTSLAVGNLCETCIKATVFTQNMLIKIAPKGAAREVVQAVCEKQCIFTVM